MQCKKTTVINIRTVTSDNGLVCCTNVVLIRAIIMSCMLSIHHLTVINVTIKYCHSKFVFHVTHDNLLHLLDRLWFSLNDEIVC